MKNLVVYDSQFGNTKSVAEAIGSALAGYGRVMVIHVSDIQAGDISGLNTLFVGSPTQQFSATGAIRNWLDKLPEGSLRGVRAAAFDTRFTKEKIDEVKILSFFASKFGYGAEPIAKRLATKGANLVLEPEGFYVADTEGPLLKQDLERAIAWAMLIRTRSL